MSRLSLVNNKSVVGGDRTDDISMSTSHDLASRPRWRMQTLGIVLYSKETVGDKKDRSGYIESMLNQRVIRQKFWQPFHLACFRWEIFLAFAIATNIDAPGSF